MERERGELEANLRAGLERICVEAADNLRRYEEAATSEQDHQNHITVKVQREYRAATEILQKKLDLERAATLAAEEKARGLESLLQEEIKRADDLDVKVRKTCRELEEEKMARESAEKRYAALELEVEASSSDLKLEKLRLQGARERVVLGRSLLRVFHSTITRIAEVQQDQFSTVLQTLADINDDDLDNSNEQSTTSPSSTLRPGPLHEHARQHRSSKRVRTTSQSTSSSAAEGPHAEEDGEDICFDMEPEVVRGITISPEYQPIWCFDAEDQPIWCEDAEDEEFPILPTEFHPDYHSHECPWHDTSVHEDPHSPVSPSTRILEDDEGNVEFSSRQCERKATFNTRLKWRAGDMATLIAELQASDDIFFSKLLRHTRIGLRHRLQLYLPVGFINQHGDKVKDSVILRTQSSTKTWRVRLCFFKKPHGSTQAQIFWGWNDFIVDNELKSGDSLIFVFNVETTCFQVYIFRTGQR